MAPTKKISTSEDDISFVSINDLRKGSYIILKGKQPCKLVSLEKSAPGKHGSAKIHVVALNIFTGKKYEEIFFSGDKVTVPVVQKNEMILLDIMEDGFLKLQVENISKYT
jgi:translation initiation factor 5A